MPASQPPKGLHFIGDGSRFIPGVPARDLTPEEVERHRDRVANSDLYTEAASASAVNEKAVSHKEKS